MSFFQRVIISFYLCVHTCEPVYMLMSVGGTCRDQKNTANYLNLKLKVILSHSTQVPGTEYRFSRRATSAIDSFLQPPQCLLIFSPHPKMPLDLDSLLHTNYLLSCFCQSKIKYNLNTSSPTLKHSSATWLCIFLTSNKFFCGNFLGFVCFKFMP